MVAKMARITWLGAVRYAAAAGRHASAWWVAVVGGLAGAAYLWASGMSSLLTQHLPADSLAAAALTLLLCVVAGVATVFVLLLCVYPVHAAFEERGGIRATLKQRLGKRMWPIVLMASGMVSFVLLFGAGAILLAMRAPTDQTAVPPAKTFVAYEIERRLKAIDQIREELETGFVPLITEGQELTGTFPTRLREGTAVALLTSYAEKLKIELEKLKIIQGTYADYEFVGRAVTFSPYNPYEAIADPMNVANTINRSPLKDTGQLKEYLSNNQFYVSFLNSPEKLRSWVSSIEANLMTARRETLDLPIQQ